MFILFEVGAGIIIFMIGFDVVNKSSKLYLGQSNEQKYLAVTEHPHKTRLSLRALGIGLLHGAASSGAIIVLVTTTLDSNYLNFTYIALFSVGLILSMSLLSLLISVPLHRGTKYFPAHHIQIVTGILAIFVGMKIQYDFSTQINTLIT